MMLEDITLEPRICPSPFTNFNGPVQIKHADLNNDGVDDVIYAAGKGGGPNVQVFDGATGSLLSSFYAFNPSFRGGVTCTIANDDIVCAAGAGGGPQVTVFDVHGNLLTSFYAFSPNFHGGLLVETSDVNGDGVQDILAGAGPGGGPQISIFNGTDYSLISAFYAHPFDNKGVAEYELTAFAGVLNVPLPAVPKQGYEMINYNVTNIDLFNLAVDQQNKIPKAFLDKLVAIGDRLVIMVGISITDYPKYASLKGLSHYGGEFGMTLWDDTPGVGGVGPNQDTVVVMNRFHDSGSLNLLLHEQGHAIDYALGVKSGQADWQAIWQSTDWYKVFNNGAYYQSSPPEAWAESFAAYFNGNTLPANVSQYFAKLS